MEGPARIYRLLLATLQVPGAEGPAGPEKPRGAGPDRSLRNHLAPRSRRERPKMLGHDGFPAGLSNGKKPEHPAR
jgi:hypothetical protein